MKAHILLLPDFVFTLVKKVFANFQQHSGMHISRLLGWLHSSPSDENICDADEERLVHDRSEAACRCSLFRRWFADEFRPGTDCSSMTPSDADLLIATELANVTLADRSRAEEEIHGIAVCQNEEPEFVNERLSMMETEISSIQRKPAYERALFLSPSYVNNKEFRLMFLRAEGFDICRAAVRLVKHFECKLEYFGLDKLVKNITQDGY